MVVARCASCAGPLDLGAVDDGRVACGSCGSWTLFESSTSTRSVPLARLAALGEEALLDRARDWLRRRGLPPPVDARSHVEHGVYAVRDARIEKGRGEVLFVFSAPPWYAAPGAWHVGRKLAGDGPEVVRLVEGLDREPWGGAPPPNPQAALTRFEQDVSLELRRTRHDEHYVVFWGDRTEVLEVPFATLDFRLEIPNPDAFDGIGTEPRHQITLNAWDGAVTGARVPRRARRLPTLPFTLAGAAGLAGVVGVGVLGLLAALLIAGAALAAVALIGG